MTGGDPDIVEFLKVPFGGQCPCCHFAQTWFHNKMNATTALEKNISGWTLLLAPYHLPNIIHGVMAGPP